MTHQHEPTNSIFRSRAKTAAPVMLLALMLMSVSVSAVVFLHGVETSCCSAESASDPIAAKGSCSDSICGFISCFLFFLPEQRHVVAVMCTENQFAWSLFFAELSPPLHVAEFPPELI